MGFNMSSSGDHMLCIISTGEDVGCDLESYGDHSLTLAELGPFLAPRERQALMAIDASARTDALYRCWTRKEAYLKLRGSGLTAPPESIEVDISRSGATALRTPEGEWGFFTWEPGPKMSASIAVRGTDWTPIFHSASTRDHRVRHCNPGVSR